jgi:hypothetical protein
MPPSSGAAAGKSIWLVPRPRGILAVRDERFAGFAQVSEGAILFGAIGPSIMSLIDGLLALVSRDVFGPEIIRPAACAAIAIIIPIDTETPGSLNMNGIPSPRENDGT